MTDGKLSGNHLLLGTDILGAKFEKGKRHSLADAEDWTVQSLLEQGWTLQVHQPQRFEDNLWRLCASLESSLGCLVGCNAYITPEGHQGLAPHYDDVSIFCCQISGRKRWKLYSANPPLANHCSGDLDSESLGVPLQEVEMTPGDVLYLPRGVIHQAIGTDETSVHLTISTYQRWTFGDLALKAVEAMLSLPPLQLALPDIARESLPVTQGNVSNLSNGIIDAFIALGAHMENHGDKIAMHAMNALKHDFMENRLPPHPKQVADKGPCPELQDTIEAVHRNFFHLFKEICTDVYPRYNEKTRTVDISGREDLQLRLVSSLGNQRDSHMMPPSYISNEDEYESEQEEEEEGDKGDEEIIFPQSYESVVAQLFKGNPIQVKNLLLNNNEEKISFATLMWNLGLVKTIVQAPRKRKADTHKTES